MKFNKTLLAGSLVVAMGLPATASADIIYDISWSGVFTMLNAVGSVVPNDSAAGSLDAFGLQTPVTGTMQFNVTTGAGSGTMVPFDFQSQTQPPPASLSFLNMQAIGNGFGAPGTLVEANMGFDWNGNIGIPVSLVLDAAGFFSAVQAAGATGLTVNQVIDGTTPGSIATTPSCSTATGAYASYLSACGPAPVWTTVNNIGWDAATASWLLIQDGNPMTADAFGGNPMPPSGSAPNPTVPAPFAGFNANFDFTTLTVTAVTDTSVIPVPAAVWLFGSGLLGLVGVARRRKKTV